MASPCVVMPRLTWIPIEPILRASPPGSAAAPTGVRCGPISPRRDRRLARGPHAREPVEDLGGDPVVAERGDRHLLEPANICVDVVVGQSGDRVGDELPRPVVGDLTPAIRLAHLDPLHPVPVLAHRQMSGLRPPALREHGVVLEQEQRRRGSRPRGAVPRGVSAGQAPRRTGRRPGGQPRCSDPLTLRSLALDKPAQQRRARLRPTDSASQTRRRGGAGPAHERRRAASCRPRRRARTRPASSPRSPWPASGRAPRCSCGARGRR